MNMSEAHTIEKPSVVTASSNGLYSLIRSIRSNRRLNIFFLTLYYLLIIAALFVIYSTDTWMGIAGFAYQAF